MQTTKETFIYQSHSDMVADLEVAGRPLSDLIDEIQLTFLADERPWIIGFSGGKDSTCILSLIYFAIQTLPKPKRHLKPIYIVSSDTLVETPVVVDQINRVLQPVR